MTALPQARPRESNDLNRPCSTKPDDAEGTRTATERRDLIDVGNSPPPGSGSITGAIDHSADAVGPPLPLSTFASAIQLVKESSIGRVRKLGGGALGRLRPGFVLERDAKLCPIRDPAVLC